jgi:DNA processing protein
MNTPAYNQLLYRIALTRVPKIGDVHARALVEYFGDAEAIFKTKKSLLARLPGIGESRAGSIVQFTDFDKVEAEIRFIKKYNIEPVFIQDDRYPKRLLQCYDAPIMLYYKGNADLNQPKIISIVGTRHHSDYGRSLTNSLVEGLAATGALIVSGLAYGIDAISHRAALANNLSTIGVLAHGLDRIYPAAHHALAKQMCLQGGLLTDFTSGCVPDKQNFPKRNRIVAGMSDAVVVIESGVKGGSIITVEIANGYNKDVFAFPGRTTDIRSSGCNYMIQTNKAMLVSSAADIIQVLQWNNNPAPKPAAQRSLFLHLSPEETIITGILEQKEWVHIDDIYLQSQLSSSIVAAAILNLELQAVIRSLPGKRYQLI